MGACDLLLNDTFPRGTLGGYSTSRRPRPLVAKSAARLSGGFFLPPSQISPFLFVFCYTDVIGLYRRFQMGILMSVSEATVAALLAALVALIEDVLVLIKVLTDLTSA